MVRMVDLVKGVGGEKEPDPKKRKKSSSPVKEEQSTSAEEERPAQAEFLESSESEADTNDGFSLRSVLSPAEEVSGEKIQKTPLPDKMRKSLTKGASDDSGSLRTPTSLSEKSKYCPFLGGRAEREKFIDYPVITNVCYAEGSQEKKLLRTITYPFSIVPAQKQRDFCLAAYDRCPLFQEKEQVFGTKEPEN